MKMKLRGLNSTLIALTLLSISLPNSHMHALVLSILNCVVFSTVECISLTRSLLVLYIDNPGLLNWKDNMSEPTDSLLMLYPSAMDSLVTQVSRELDRNLPNLLQGW